MSIYNLNDFNRKTTAFNFRGDLLPQGNAGRGKFHLKSLEGTLTANTALTVDVFNEYECEQLMTSGFEFDLMVQWNSTNSANALNVDLLIVSNNANQAALHQETWGGGPGNVIGRYDALQYTVLYGDNTNVTQPNSYIYGDIVFDKFSVPGAIYTVQGLCNGYFLNNATGDVYPTMNGANWILNNPVEFVKFYFNPNHGAGTYFIDIYAR